MATAAVLFKNPEIIDVVIKNIENVNHFLFPPSLYKKLDKTSKKPVLTNERLMIKIAPIVTTALFPKPLIASSIVKILHAHNIAIVANAVTSIGRISKIKNITINNKIIKNNGK